ncbi:MAG: hypothetical protein ACYCTF_05800 [Acidiferrobacter sp.]
MSRKTKTASVDFDYWEQLPTFVGPRISPGLRVRRLVEERNRRDEFVRRMTLATWAAEFREAQSYQDGCPKPHDPEVRARAVLDLYIDEMRASGQCTMRREDEKWL